MNDGVGHEFRDHEQGRAPSVLVLYPLGIHPHPGHVPADRHRSLQQPAHGTRQVVPWARHWLDTGPPRCAATARSPRGTVRPVPPTVRSAAWLFLSYGGLRRWREGRCSLPCPTRHRAVGRGSSRHTGVLATRGTSRREPGGVRDGHGAGFHRPRPQEPACTPPVLNVGHRPRHDRVTRKRHRYGAHGRLHGVRGSESRGGRGAALPGGGTCAAGGDRRTVDHGIAGHTGHGTAVSSCLVTDTMDHSVLATTRAGRSPHSSRSSESS